MEVGGGPFDCSSSVDASEDGIFATVVPFDDASGCGLWCRELVCRMLPLVLEVDDVELNNLLEFMTAGRWNCCCR